MTRRWGKKDCDVVECKRKHFAWGYCKLHYRRVKKHGDPLIISAYDPVKHFWDQVVDKGFCWEWQGHTDTAGYGSMDTPALRRVVGNLYSAHKIAYVLLIGPVPEGLTLDHLCRNIVCCNPSHLEPVTNVVNVMRGNGWGAINARKTECKRGHPLSGDNIYLATKKNKSGSTYVNRNCRACQRVRYEDGRKNPKSE